MESGNISRDFGIVCTMKKFLFILIIIFICGILSADICLKQMQESEVLIGLTMFEQYATAEISFKDVFWNLLYERVKLFIGIILLCFTPLKERLCQIIIPVFGFIWGFFLMSCIGKMGIAGMIVGFASVFPHWGLYGLAIWMISSGNKSRSYYRKSNAVMNVGKYIFIVLLFVTACIMESLIGVHFIPWVIRLSLV